MAGIYLSNGDSNAGRNDFHLGDKPLLEIVGQLGFRPEDCASAIPGQTGPEHSLCVIVSVAEDEARGTDFQAGYYRTAIMPHVAMRRCGVGFSAILGGQASSA